MKFQMNVNPMLLDLFAIPIACLFATSCFPLIWVKSSLTIKELDCRALRGGFSGVREASQRGTLL
jgi:hypothetical protein